MTYQSDYEEALKEQLDYAKTLKAETNSSLPRVEFSELGLFSYSYSYRLRGGGASMSYGKVSTSSSDESRPASPNKETATIRPGFKTKTTTTNSGGSTTYSGVTFTDSNTEIKRDLIDESGNFVLRLDTITIGSDSRTYKIGDENFVYLDIASTSSVEYRCEWQFTPFPPASPPGYQVFPPEPPPPPPPPCDIQIGIDDAIGEGYFCMSFDEYQKFLEANRRANERLDTIISNVTNLP